MNWTGLGVVFPRSKWLEVRQRSELLRAGVYILVGYQEDDLPLSTIGRITSANFSASRSDGTAIG